MSTLVWAGLVANALVHLRYAVLEVQDGEDRVQAGDFKPFEVICWQKGGAGIRYVLFRTVMSPIITAFHVSKLLLFPRGIKSKYAKEQEVKTAADAKQEELDRLLTQTMEHEAFIRAWAPGELLLAEPQPQQFALTWNDAADVFDGFCDQVASTKGQPWSPAPERLKATVQK